MKASYHASQRFFHRWFRTPSFGRYPNFLAWRFAEKPAVPPFVYFPTRDSSAHWQVLCPAPQALRQAYKDKRNRFWGNNQRWMHSPSTNEWCWSHQFYKPAKPFVWFKPNSSSPSDAKTTKPCPCCRWWCRFRLWRESPQKYNPTSRPVSVCVAKDSASTPNWVHLQTIGWEYQAPTACHFYRLFASLLHGWNCTY